MDNADALKWDSLREDLILLQGPSNQVGAPTWILQDPSAGKFYRLGWLDFEILKRWHFSHAAKILQDIAQSTPLKPSAEDIVNLYKFLKASYLLNMRSEEDTKTLIDAQDLKIQDGWIKKILKNYLFFRVPLVRPDALLNKMKKPCAWMFTNAAFFMVFFAATLGAYLVFRDFNNFIAGFTYLQSPTGLIAGFLTLAFAKVIHEFGHGIACKHYGCRVPTMGVAFIVLWPLLWTNTTDAWRLREKNKRLSIDGAGIMAELAMAAIASILWAISPPGFFKDAMHMLAGITWIMTLFVNLNPFMRFDGYYLLSDYLDIPNLQERSFTLAKRWMRSVLWGIEEDKVTHFSPRTEKWLIIYAYGTWIYRFFLFLGIALLVYHLFFKALGVFLMVVEIWWFIARPINNELSYWIKNKKTMTFTSKRKAIFIGGFTGALCLLFIPWSNTASAPAIIKSKTEVPIFIDQAGILKESHVTSGQNVRQGDILFTLHNPDNIHQVNLVTNKKTILEQELKNKSTDQAFYRDASLLQDELMELEAEVKLKQIDNQKLIIRAPTEGIITDIPETVQQSSWLARKEFMGLIKSNESQIEAFVTESQIDRVSVGAAATFYNHHIGKSFQGVVQRIDLYPVKDIPYKELTSDYGGDIVMKVTTQGSMPTERHYKVVIELSEHISLSRTSVGTLKIQSKPRSIFTTLSRNIMSILIQESAL